MNKIKLLKYIMASLPFLKLGTKLENFTYFQLQKLKISTFIPGLYSLKNNDPNQLQWTKPELQYFITIFEKNTKNISAGLLSSVESEIVLMIFVHQTGNNWYITYIRK